MPLSDMDFQATTLEQDLNLDPSLDIGKTSDIEYKTPDSPEEAANKAAKVAFSYDTPDDAETLTRNFTISRSFEDQERKRKAAEQGLHLEGMRQTVMADYMHFAGENNVQVGDADLEALKMLGEADLTALVDDPKVIFEKAFARKVINTSFEQGYKQLPEPDATDPWEQGRDDVADESPISDLFKGALSEDQQKSLDMLDAGEKHLAKQEIADGILKNFVKDREDRFLAMRAADHLFNLAIPGLWWYASHDAMGEPYSNAFWPGNNKLEQIQYWWSIEDPKEAHDKLQEAVNNIATLDPVAAMNFLEQINNYSISDQYLDNVYGAMDIASLVPLGKIGKAGKLTANAVKAPVRATAVVSKKLRDILKGTSSRIGKGWSGPAKIKAFNGESIATARARLDGVKAELLRQADLTNSRQDVSDVMDTAQAIFNPERMVTGYKGHLDPAEITTLTENMVSRAGSTAKALEELTRIERLSDEMIADALDVTKQRFGKIHATASRYISDIRHVDASEAKSNNDYFKFVMTNTSGEGFGSRAAAEKTAEDIYGLVRGDYAIEEDLVGDVTKHFITVVRAADETEKRIIDAMVIKSRHKTPDLVTNIFFGALKSKDAKISQSMATDAAVSVYGRSGVVSYLEGQARAIVNLSPKQRDKLQLFIERQRDFSPGGSKAVGIDSDNLMELQSDWRKLMGSDIDAATADAYMSYKQMKDTFWYVMNDMELKQKNRLGVEQYYFPVPHTKDEIRAMNKSGLIPTAKKEYTKEGVEGKVIDQIPWGSEQDAGIMMIDMKTGTNDMWRKQDVTKIEQTRINEEVANGNYRVIHVSPHGRKTLQKLLNDDDPPYIIHYLIVPKPKSAALKYLQLPYQEGFRIESAGKWFVSQPTIKEEAGRVGTRINRYMGDKNILNFADEATAKKWIPLVNEARRLLEIASRVKRAKLKSPEYAAYKQYVHDNLPWGDREFSQMFLGPNKVYNLKHNFMLRRKDSSLSKDHKLEDLYPNFVNDVDNEHNLFGGMVDMEFSRERNKLISTIDTDTTGMSTLKPAPLIDPWTVYEKTATRIGNDVFADDLKLKNAAMLIKEFSDILEGKFEDLMRNPYKHIVGNKIRKEADPRRMLAFRGARRSFMELVGTQSDFSRKIEGIKRNLGQNLVALAKKVPNVKGKYLGKQLDLDWANITENTWEWALEKDPARLLRSVGLHTKIGFFNPLQWVMQAQGIAHTSMRAGPEIAYRAAAATWMMKGLFFNPDMVVDFSKKATKLGWKEREFQESFKALLKSKFYIVDHSYGLLSEAVTPRYIKGSTKSNLSSASLMPFKHGEFANRLMAWNAAYLKWKKQNPVTALLADDDIARVTKLADDYTLNMSSASSAMWEKGWLGVPTQFFSYQARLMEQMLGGRVTGAERLRMFAGYSLLYGMPIGLTGTALGGVWPAHKDIAAYLLENGVDVDENMVSRFLYRGLMDVTVNALTDEDLAVSERYGPSGNPFLRDIFQGNTNFFQLMMGASGRIAAGDNSSAGLIADVYGVAGSALAAAFSSTETFYPMTTQRLHDAMTTISTYNNAWKAWSAYNYGKWFSKRGTYLDGDISAWDGILAGVSGTIPQDLAEGFVMMENTKERKAYMKHVGQEVKKWTQLALDPNTSYDDMISYYEKINDILFIESGANDEERVEIMQNATAGLESALTTIQLQYMSESPEKLDYMLKKLEGKQ